METQRRNFLFGKATVKIENANSTTDGPSAAEPQPESKLDTNFTKAEEFFTTEAPG